MAIKIWGERSANKTMGITNFSLQNSQVRMMEKIHLKAGILYFLSLHCPNNRVENTSSFYMLLFSFAGNRLFLVIKNKGGAFASPLHAPS
jgi:hypothetical protein